MKDPLSPPCGSGNPDQHLGIEDCLLKSTMHETPLKIPLIPRMEFPNRQSSCHLQLAPTAYLQRRPPQGLDQSLILTVLEGQQEQTELEKEYHYPPTTTVRPAVLTNQWDFFFLFFVLINYTNNNRCMVTPIEINFSTVTPIGINFSTVTLIGFNFSMVTPIGFMKRPRSSGTQM